MLENYCDIIAIYCIILNYCEIIAIIEKSIIAHGCTRPLCQVPTLTSPTTLTTLTIPTTPTGKALLRKATCLCFHHICVKSTYNTIQPYCTRYQFIPFQFCSQGGRTSLSFWGCASSSTPSCQPLDTWSTSATWLEARTTPHTRLRCLPRQAKLLLYMCCHFLLGWPQHQWVYRGTDADGDGPLPHPQRVPPHPFPGRPKICWLQG